MARHLSWSKNGVQHNRPREGTQTQRVLGGARRKDIFAKTCMVLGDQRAVSHSTAVRRSLLGAISVRALKT